MLEAKVDPMRRQEASLTLTLWRSGGAVEVEELQRWKGGEERWREERGGEERWKEERGALLIIFAASTSAM